MAIEVAVVGNGAFKGSKSNLTDYSVQEVITPLDASETSPGVGTITFGAVEADDSTLLLDNEVELRDGARGIATGTVRAINSGDYALSVTADSILSTLLAERNSEPFEGTLEAAVAYYLTLVGITGGFEVQDTIASRSVALPGWSGPVIEALSNLCVAQQIEMSVVYDRIVFREARINTAVLSRQTSQGWKIDRGSPALSVEIYHYDYTRKTDNAYPNSIETTTGPFQVDTNETLEPIRVAVPASMYTVSQPVAVNTMGPNPPTGGSGAYVVLGSDDLPIPPAEWNAKGGKVTVSIDPEKRDELIIQIVGMNEPNDPRAPYRVGAMRATSSQGTSTYNAFYIRGTGLFYNKQLLTVPTGATNTQVLVGTTIDNPMISTRAQALTAVQKTVLRYSGLNYTVSGDAVSINREGAGNEFATAPLSAFDEEFEGQTLSALDARGWLFADFDQFFEDLVTDQFENQLFGNAGGARVLGGEANFRIDSATTTPASVSYSASMDTLFSDWDGVWNGQLLGDWDIAFEGLTLRDWDIKPLKVPPTPTTPVETYGYGQGPYGHTFYGY